MAEDKQKQKRKTLPQMTTPRVAFKYPRLNTPDYGNDEFPKPDGEYSVRFVAQADDPAIVKFIAKLTPLFDAAVANAEEEFKKLKVDQRKKLGKVQVNDLFKTIYDEETEEPTGEIEFKFAMKASGKDKKGKAWSRKPAIFDAKGNPMTKAPDIWGGTVGIISFKPSDYFIPGTGAAGLSLKLDGVQIIDLVQGGQKSAKSLGFEAQEDGYEYDESDAPTTSEEDEDSGNTEASEEDF